MKNMNFPAAIIVSIFISGFAYEANALGGGAMKSVKDARAKTSGEVIKCSPEGGGEFKKPSEAITSLKKGMTLKLMPGTYMDEMVISCDGITIEGGEPGKRCDINLELTGKDYFVRNLFCNTIRCNLDITLVDSAVKYFMSEKDSKADIVFDNCCIGALDIMSYNKSIELNRCTICNGGNAALMHGSKILIEKCVLYAKDVVFMLGTSKPKIDIDNSVVYGDAGFAKDIASGKIAKTMDDAKKQRFQANIMKKKNVLEEKPLFDKEPSVTAVFDVKYDTSYREGWTRKVVYPSGIMNLADWILKEDSPGRKEGFGASLNADGVLVPP